MNRKSGGGLLLVIALVALTASCSGPANYPRATRADQPPPRRIEMRGESLFFAGALRVAATVSRGLPHRERGEGVGESGHKGSGTGGRRHGGGLGRPPGDSGGDRSDAGEARPMRQPQMSAPPLTLQLKFSNVSASPIEVTVRDVKSELGDFAARPERVTIASGAEAELDPMVSELGVVSAEIPLTVSLRSNGKAETQILTVKDTANPPSGSDQR